MPRGIPPIQSTAHKLKKKTTCNLRNVPGTKSSFRGFGQYILLGRVDAAAALQDPPLQLHHGPRGAAHGVLARVLAHGRPLDPLPPLLLPPPLPPWPDRHPSPPSTETPRWRRPSHLCRHRGDVGAGQGGRGGSGTGGLPRRARLLEKFGGNNHMPALKSFKSTYHPTSQ